MEVFGIFYGLEVELWRHLVHSLLSYQPKLFQGATPKNIWYCKKHNPKEEEPKRCASQRIPRKHTPSPKKRTKRNVNKRKQKKKVEKEHLERSDSEYNESGSEQDSIVKEEPKPPRLLEPEAILLIWGILPIEEENKTIDHPYDGITKLIRYKRRRPITYFNKLYQKEGFIKEKIQDIIKYGKCSRRIATYSTNTRIENSHMRNSMNR